MKIDGLNWNCQYIHRQLSIAVSNIGVSNSALSRRQSLVPCFALFIQYEKMFVEIVKSINDRNIQSRRSVVSNRLNMLHNFDLTSLNCIRKRNKTKPTCVFSRFFFSTYNILFENEIKQNQHVFFPFFLIYI